MCDGIVCSLIWLNMLILADVISDQDALLKATGLAGEDQPLGYAPFNSSHVVAAAAFIKAGLDLVSDTIIYLSSWRTALIEANC